MGGAENERNGKRIIGWGISSALHNFLFPKRIKLKITKYPVEVSRISLKLSGSEYFEQNFIIQYFRESSCRVLYRSSFILACTEQILSPKGYRALSRILVERSRKRVLKFPTAEIRYTQLRRTHCLKSFVPRTKNYGNFMMLPKVWG